MMFVTITVFVVIGFCVWAICCAAGAADDDIEKKMSAQMEQEKAKVENEQKQ